MSSSRILFLAASLLVLAARATQAQVACGTVVGRGEQLTLTADVGPCDNDDGAAIVIDGGRVDLGGHTVSCQDQDLDGDLPQGVVLLGKKSRLSNGTITGCSNGVGLAGVGKHRVENVTITGSSDDGIDIAQGSKNRILGCTTMLNGSDGIFVRTDKNKLIGNTASQNVQDGIDVLPGADKNKITDAIASNNGDDGIEIGGDKNKVTSPTANQNAEDGLDLLGDKNKVRGGTAQGNLRFDVVGCADNSVKDLTASALGPDCP